MSNTTRFEVVCNCHETSKHVIYFNFTRPYLRNYKNWNKNLKCPKKISFYMSSLIGGLRRFFPHSLNALPTSFDSIRLPYTSVCPAHPSDQLSSYIQLSFLLHFALPSCYNTPAVWCCFRDMATVSRYTLILHAGVTLAPLVFIFLRNANACNIYSFISYSFLTPMIQTSPFDHCIQS